MNHYTYDELIVGQTESFSVTVTEKMMMNFFQTTGDSNQLHMDPQFARQKTKGLYKENVVYGMLTASFLSTLAGVHLPGENALIHRVEAEFPAPVYVGDVLTFTGRISRKDDNFRVFEMKVVAVNGRGQKVCRGKMRVGVIA